MQKDIHIPEGNPTYEKLKIFIKQSLKEKGTLIMVLHKAQELFGYLPTEVQYFIAKEMNIPLSEVSGVISFYNFFRTQPIGKHIINVCLGTACHVKGGSQILQTLQDQLGIKEGETTECNTFTLSTARCFGACGLAPVVMVDEDVYGRVSTKKIKTILDKYRQKEVVKA